MDNARATTSTNELHTTTTSALPRPDSYYQDRQTEQTFCHPTRCKTRRPTQQPSVQCKPRTNFQTLEINEGRKKSNFKYSSKGHSEQMEAWLAFLLGKEDHPLPYPEARKSMQLTFAVLQSIRESRLVSL